MSKAASFLAKITAKGIKTEVRDGQIALIDPSGEIITPRIKELTAKYKPELLLILGEDPLRRMTKPRKRRELEGFVIQHPEKRNKEDRIDPHELLREPEHPEQLTFPFGAEQLPFGIWDGETLSGKWIGFDTETHAIEDPYIPRLVLGSVSDGQDHYVIARDRFAEFLQLHQDRSFIAHNMKFDFWVVETWLGKDAAVLWEIADAGRLHCSDIMEQLILLAKFDAFPRNHSLDKTAKFHLGFELFGKDDPRRIGFAGIDGQPLESVPLWYLQYAVQDAIAAVLIHSKQRKIAARLQPNPKDLLPHARQQYGLLTEKLQVQASIVLEGIYHTGLHLDPEKIAPARDQLCQEIFRLSEELDTHSTEERPLLQRYKQDRCVTDENRGFKVGNKTSTPQKHEDNIRAIFDEVAKEHNLKPPRSSKAEKLSLTKDFWADYRDNPVVDLFIDLQGRQKLLSFFFDLKGDHIHPGYRPIVRSGRVSCYRPNLQQMPRSGNVREMFIPSPGHVLFAIDFKALELATLSAVCLQKYGESVLAEVINSGRDAHAYSYCKIHGMTEKAFAKWKASDPKAAKAARDAIKGVTFGVPGSMQPAGLTQYVKKAYGQEISLETATEYREKLIHEVYPEWRRYLAQVGTRVSTLSGRVRGRIERSGQLFNTQFQGLACDGAKACLWKLLRAGYRLVGFIHDEFLVELPEADDYTEPAERINHICCETMEQFTPGVEISCEYAVSRCWSKSAEATYDGDGRLVPWVSY